MQIYVWEHDAFTVRRRSLRLRRLKVKILRYSDGGELQCDTQQPSAKQISSANGSSDRLSRKLSRRVSGLDQALDPCQQKLFNCQKENTKLQEELSEVYALKNKFAELLKLEVEKSSFLEKELKFFQAQAVTALSDRDQSLLEIEKFQRKEDDMMEKLTEIQDSLDHLNSEYTKEKSLCADFHKELEKSNVEIDLYRKVVEKFWRVRAQSTRGSDFKSIQEKAAILLQDDEGIWSHGELNKVQHDEAKQARENLVIIQEEFQVCCDSLANCEAEIEKERDARKHAENALLDCRQQLSSLAELVDSELRQLSLVKAGLKEDVAVFLLEEKKWILSLPEAWKHFTKEGSEITSGRLNINVDEASEKVPQDSKIASEVNNKTSRRTGDLGSEVAVDGVSAMDKAAYSCNGTLENGDNLHCLDNNEEVTLGKVDFSVIKEDSIMVADNGVRESNLTEVEVASNDETIEALKSPEDNDTIKHKETTVLNGNISESSELDEKEATLAIVGKKLEHEEAKEVVTGTLKGLFLDDESGSGDAVVDNHMMVSVDDSKEALAQALQEKVAALILLSQQEERHILESNTNVVLESEISSLKQQLLQVTSEKVEALVELARAHEELLKLQEQGRTFKQAYQYNRTLSSGHLSPVRDYGVFSDNDRNLTFSEGVKKAPAQSYLKHLWSKGPELGVRTKSFSHMLTSKASKENDPVGIARLRVENATLRESLTSIRHLCKSANRLRLTIARVAAESSAQTESSIQAAVEAVDGVISEALHLKVALHSSLPVDDLGWNSIGSPLARAGEMGLEGSDNDANDDLDIVSFFGLEIVRLVLLAAQLQKRFLGQNV
eukprot:c24338_g1_i5 orf=475-2985(+)